MLMLHRPLIERGWGSLRRLFRLTWQALGERERRLVAALGLASLIVLLVGSAAELHATRVIPAVGGRLTVRSPDPLQVLNPLATQTEFEQVISRLIYRGLFEVNSRGELEPDLAASLERSPDQRRITVRLKPGLVFHDGQPVTARDVEASIGFMQDPANLAPQGRFWQSVSVEIVDPLTVAFQLSQPYTPFEWSLNFPVLPGHLPIPQSRERLVGSGPYQARVTRADSRGIREMRFTPFGAYHRGPAQISELVFKVGLNGRGAKLVLSLPTERWLFFNTGRPPLDSVELRRRLLAKQALPQEARLSLVVAEGDTTEDVAEYLTAWQRDGAVIALEFKTLPQLEREVLPGRAFDLLLFRLQPGGDPDSYPFWHSSQATEIGRNLSHLKDRELDRLLEEGRLMPNGEARRAIYEKVEARLMELAPGIRLKRGDQKSLMINRAVKGAAPRQGLVLADVMNDIHTYYFREKRVRR